jgi:hypothetical protein
MIKGCYLRNRLIQPRIFSALKAIKLMRTVCAAQPKMMPASGRSRGGRLEGASDRELVVVAGAKPGEFVATKRLEAEAGGTCTWRSIFMGWFRSASLPLPPAAIRPAAAQPAQPHHSAP